MNPLSKLDKDQLREIFKNSDDRILNQIADKLYDLDVDGDNLVNMTKDDYMELGFTFGQRKKLMRVIADPLEFVSTGTKDKRKDITKIKSSTWDLPQSKPPEPPVSKAPPSKPPPPGPPDPPQVVKKTWVENEMDVKGHTTPVYTPRFEEPSPLKRRLQMSPILETPSSPKKTKHSGIFKDTGSSKLVHSSPQSPKISHPKKKKESEVELIVDAKEQRPKKRPRDSKDSDKLKRNAKRERQLISKPVSPDSVVVNDSWSKLREKVTEYATNQDKKVCKSPPSHNPGSSSPSLTLSPPVETSTAESAKTKLSKQKSNTATKPKEESTSGINLQTIAKSTVKASVQGTSTMIAAHYGLTESFVWDPKHRHFFEASTARVYKPENPLIGNFWDVETNIYSKVHPQQYKLITAHYAVDSDIKQQLPEVQSAQAGYYQGYTYPQSGYAYGSAYPYSAYGYNDTVSSAAYGEAISQFYDQANLVFQSGSGSSPATTIAYEDNTVQTTAEDYFQQKTIVEQQAAEYQRLIAKRQRAEYEKQLEQKRKSKPKVEQVIPKPVAPTKVEPPRPKRRRTSRFSAGPAKVHGLGKFEVISQGK